MKHKEIFQNLVDNVIYNEKQNYCEYLSDEFPEIDEDMYFNLDTYTREDMNHICVYALRARDLLLEDVTCKLGT